MNYVELQAGSNQYKLALSVRNITALEKRLGCNPMGIFGAGDVIPGVTQMVDILWASLQKYQANMSLDKAYDVFEEWLADGHVMTDFIPVILDVYRCSGIIKDNSGELKN